MPSVSRTHQLPYAQLPFFSKLFVDYCTDFDKVAPFYAGPFTSHEALHSVTEKTLAYSRDRSRLADVLLEQNERWGLDEATRANIERLRDPESVCVITGQQVGLFVGPLYTPYKILTAIMLAKEWTETLGRPVVPVFWLADEDHDFAEIASTTFLRDQDVVTHTYRHSVDPSDVNTGPVGRLALSNDIQTLITEVEQTLPPSLFKAEVMELVRECYTPGRRLGDAFALMIRRLFPDAGLVIVSLDEPALKELLVPLFQKELAEPEASTHLLAEATQVLENGYHGQVNARATNLFVMDEAGRLPLDANNGHLKLRHTATEWTPQEAASILKESPERFSPNVVLRPIAQDALFPTVAYVAGPGETAYFAQYKNIYAWAGVPMPLIYPRISLTVVDPAIERIINKNDIPLSGYAEDPNKLFRRHVLEALGPDIDPVFDELKTALDEVSERVKISATAIEPTLEKAAGAYRAGLQKDLARFKERIVKAEKKKQAIFRNRIARIHAELFPNGKPQERIFSPLHMMNRYGTGFFADLANYVSLDTAQHTVLTVR